MTLKMNGKYIYSVTVGMILLTCGCIETYHRQELSSLPPVYQPSFYNGTNAILIRLKVDFTNRVYIVGTNRIEMSFSWMSKESARYYPGMVSLYLVSNEVAGFMTNTRGWDTNAEGIHIWFGADHDFMAQIEKDLRSYLIKIKHPEEKIIFQGLNADIFDYILDKSQNKSTGKDKTDP